MTRVLAMLLLSACLYGCREAYEEPAPQTIEELLSSQSWISDRFVLRGQEFDAFNWDCRFLEKIEGYSYNAGDYGRLQVEIELKFRLDSGYRRILHFSRFHKCAVCSQFELETVASDTLHARYIVVDDIIYFGTRDFPTQFYAQLDYSEPGEITLLEFYDVFDVQSNSECWFNDVELMVNRQYKLDVVFKPLE